MARMASAPERCDVCFNNLGDDPNPPRVLWLWLSETKDPPAWAPALVLTACGHTFHRVCIDLWIRKTDCTWKNKGGLAPEDNPEAIPRGPCPVCKELCGAYEVVEVERYENVNSWVYFRLHELEKLKKISESQSRRLRKSAPKKEMRGLVADINQKSYEKNCLIAENNDLKYQLLNLRQGTDPDDSNMYGIKTDTFGARILRCARRNLGLDVQPETKARPNQRPLTPTPKEDLNLNKAVLVLCFEEVKPRKRKLDDLTDSEEEQNEMKDDNFDVSDSDRD